VSVSEEVRCCVGGGVSCALREQSWRADRRSRRRLWIFPTSSSEPEPTNPAASQPSLPFPPRGASLVSVCLSVCLMQSLFPRLILTRPADGTVRLRSVCLSRVCCVGRKVPVNSILKGQVVRRQRERESPSQSKTHLPLIHCLRSDNLQ
jgi:hypothetical protein